MKPMDEVLKTLEMLKSAGFEPVDAVFKGVVAVMNKSTLELLQKLADHGEALGTLTIIYKTPDGGVRTIEIPMGSEEEAEKAVEKETVSQNPSDGASGV